MFFACWYPELGGCWEPSEEVVSEELAAEEAAAWDEASAILI